MNPYALLSTERPLDRPIAAARLALSRRRPPVECARYLAAFQTAIRQEFPPFMTDLYAELYRAAAQSGQWLATSFITHAESEGQNARRLWNFAACAADEEERQLLKRHACDVSNRSLAALSLLDLTFPGAVAGQFRSQLDQLSPHYSMKQKLPAARGSAGGEAPALDDYVQMNIASIRAMIHRVLQYPAVSAHCPAENVQRATRILESLLRDDLSHAAYTGVLIENKTADLAPAKCEALFCRCVRELNRFTSEEPIDYSYHLRFGTYP